MVRAIQFTILMALMIAMPAAADAPSVVTITPDSVKEAFKKKGYSPYAGRSFPTKVLWGDTHLHTNLSLDARAFGVTLGPEEAYRFARGEEATSTHGERLQLSRPLDWLAITDHSDGIGAMNEIVGGNPILLSDPIGRQPSRPLPVRGLSLLVPPRSGPDEGEVYPEPNSSP